MGKASTTRASSSERVCKCGCGTEFKPKRVDQKFATSNCKTRYTMSAYEAGLKVVESKGMHAASFDKSERLQRFIEALKTGPKTTRELIDRLWVRETWAHDGPDLETSRTRFEDALSGGETYGPYYRATESAPGTLRWRPSIHMPRWASRITLEVTGTRVERLQSLNEGDAKAEGAMYHDGRGVGHSGWRHDFKDVHADARSSFARLWSEINGPESWDSNPWVWVVEFRRVAP